jgi:hypothetical protein
MPATALLLCVTGTVGTLDKLDVAFESLDVALAAELSARNSKYGAAVLVSSDMAAQLPEQVCLHRHSVVVTVDTCTAR